MYKLVSCVLCYSAGGIPVMDWHLVQSCSELSVLLHASYVATETGIKYRCVYLYLQLNICIPVATAH